MADHLKLDCEAIVISQDSYYLGGNADTNYDIPSSIDFDLFIKLVCIL